MRRHRLGLASKSNEFSGTLELSFSFGAPLRPPPELQPGQPVGGRSALEFCPAERNNCSCCRSLRQSSGAPPQVDTAPREARRGRGERARLIWIPTQSN